ncbi:hypothetical protein EI94DRAFT_1624790 [Lactarius quietus]|nr:hypothetical protein EI94DRAFT_1624790 [Lactarius quietus]
MACCTAPCSAACHYSAPPNSRPSYFMPMQLTHHSAPLIDPNESVWSHFLCTQVFAQDKLPGNVNTVAGVGLFIGGTSIQVVCRWGELFMPV